MTQQPFFEWSEVDRLKKLSNYLGRIYAIEKEAWMLGEMEKRVPPVMIRWAKERKHLDFWFRYLVRHHYEMIEVPNDGITVLTHHRVEISRFYFQVGEINP